MSDTVARSEPPLVIGVGTEHRRDDRCGLDVVRALRPKVGDRARLVEASSDATELLDLWADRREVLVVDAVRSGAPPGTRRVTRVLDDVAPPSGATSTHGLSLSDAIALGRTLGQMPHRLSLYTIEADDVSIGDGLTPAVAEAVARTVEALAVELLAPDPLRGPSDA